MAVFEWTDLMPGHLMTSHHENESVYNMADLERTDFFYDG